MRSDDQTIRCSLRAPPSNPIRPAFGVGETLIHRQHIPDLIGLAQCAHFGAAYDVTNSRVRLLNSTSSEHPLRTDAIFVVATALLLIAGGVARLVVDARTAHVVWMCAAVVLGLPLVVRTTLGAFRGHFATDIVASLSIVAGIALAQPVVSLVVILMLRGGTMLERYAEGRASRAVRALESAAPRFAHVLRGQTVEDVRVDAVQSGDVLLVRPGEVVPCDGVVVTGQSDLDTSSLTGEATPVRTSPNLEVASGTRNGLGSFQLRVLRPAAESQYARIVQLVRAAQADKAPLQRLADRYAVWFTPVTLLLCAVTYLITRDWSRVLAILAVATPCPLILATPIAIIGGINRAAQKLVIIKSGGALERLSDVTHIAFDKTGTLTFGSPRISGIRVASGYAESQVLAFAASVEKHSSHHLARVITDEADRRGLAVPDSASHTEVPGDGISGEVDGQRVLVGSRAFAIANAIDGAERAVELASVRTMMTAYVVIDARLVGVVEFEDAERPDAARAIGALRDSGLQLSLLSGDDIPTVQSIAQPLGITNYRGDLKPGDKAKLIEGWRAEGATVMMIGDGINDAVALSVADVGVAMAASGSTISSEAADVVILNGSLTSVPEMLRIGKRTKRIAVQSIRVGLGLSALGMGLAAVGLLSPLAGAAAQELVDIAVIVNALRTAITPKT